MMFLSGFEPRFEEAFLLLGANGQRLLITGNESESYAAITRLPGMTVLRRQTLSLMAQDRTQQPRLVDCLRDAGLWPGDSIGFVGWKYLEPEEDEDFSKRVFRAERLCQMFRRIVGTTGRIGDATAILMHPEMGLRAAIDADQIAAFEWAATRCSLAVWRIVSGVREGDSEFDAVARMAYAGDPLNVHTMFASASPGATIVGLRSPTGRRLQRGDGVTTAIGHWGALSSRAGLFDIGNDGFLKRAGGYFEALVAWYDAAGIGVTGGDLHAAIVDRLAVAGLASLLNPGHLTGHEEWMHSPVRPGCPDPAALWHAVPIDVIPSPMPAGQALNCEDPVTLADADLCAELNAKHPDCFARIEARRAFMREGLGIDVKPSILPLSSTPLYLPPFWLKPDHVLVRD